MTAHDLASLAHHPIADGTHLTLITDAVTIRVSTSDTGGAYALYETQTPPSGGQPPHAQRYDDVTYLVIEGTYDVLIGEDRVELHPGGHAFAPRGMVHAFVNPGPEPARMLVLVTPGCIHEQFLEEVGDRAGRAAWQPDIARLLAVAPKYGIEFLRQEDAG
jgi:quercetin dioxygenase-like cupin family protein